MNAITAVRSLKGRTAGARTAAVTCPAGQDTRRISSTSASFWICSKRCETSKRKVMIGSEATSGTSDSKFATTY